MDRKIRGCKWGMPRLTNIPVGVSLRCIMSIQVEHIFISPDHNYYGHHEQPPGETPVTSLQAVECVAGSGLVGDRFFDYKSDYRGQVTFFSAEVHSDLCARFKVSNRGPEVFRRNIIVSGVDLNTLIGRDFTLQGVRFLGMCECTPCHWMEQAFCPGAEEAMRGRGGLRAKILSSGMLRVSDGNPAN